MALKPIEMSRVSQPLIPGFGWQALLAPDPYEPKSEVLGLIKFVHTPMVGRDVPVQIVFKLRRRINGFNPNQFLLPKSGAP